MRKNLLPVSGESEVTRILGQRLTVASFRVMQLRPSCKFALDHADISVADFNFHIIKIFWKQPIVLQIYSLWDRAVLICASGVNPLESSFRMQKNNSAITGT